MSIDDCRLMIGGTTGIDDCRLMTDDCRLMIDDCRLMIEGTTGIGDCRSTGIGDKQEFLKFSFDRSLPDQNIRTKEGKFFTMNVNDMTTLQEDTIPSEYWDDRDWAWDHYAEFVKQYPDQWIAVCHKKVVAHGESLDETEIIARERTGMTHFPVIFVEGRIHVYPH